MGVLEYPINAKELEETEEIEHIKLGPTHSEREEPHKSTNSSHYGAQYPIQRSISPGNAQPRVHN